MSTVRILKNDWFTKFAHKEGISDTVLVDAVHRAERGLVDADLGSGLIKQRVARKGQGKSGGYRTLIAARRGDRSVFLFGFAKSDRENLNAEELGIFRDLAKSVLAMTEEAIVELVKTGKFVEVKSDEQGKGIQE